MDGCQPHPRVETDFQIGPGVTRPAAIRRYQRAHGQPLERPLRVYALDPTLQRLEGCISELRIPYEPLLPGPVGALLEGDNRDGEQEVAYRRADRDDPMVLLRDGYDPSPADPRFHQQMDYAVCSKVYDSFRHALGREVSWGFDRAPGSPARLRLRPHAFREANAFYDNENGEIAFGYYPAPESQVVGRNLPGGFVFTCLSHDIIAHEMTHALLDGLRAHFCVPSSSQVLGFHEGFADLVALFQHFSCDRLVDEAVRGTRGKLGETSRLAELGRQFGETTGRNGPLRRAFDNLGSGAAPTLFDPDAESHAMGAVLVAAVFEAFLTVYRRKTARLVRLATGGSGVLPPGEISADLRDALAAKARSLAAQFLNVCIRAIDYCPPVDIELGDFLRAAITADSDLVPDDPWGYRDAWLDAFRRHGIYPRRVENLSIEALRWRAPERPLPPVPGLSFAELRFAGDPGHPASAEELKRQAHALGQFVARPEHRDVFALAMPDDPRLAGDPVEPPCVQSVRALSRVGPDGQVVFDLVAEVTQRRIARRGNSRFELYGGATVMLGPNAEVRYLILKRVTSPNRIANWGRFAFSREGARFWHSRGRRRIPRPQMFRLVHHESSA